MLAKQMTAEFISSLPSSTLLAFTDGPALGNPGPCGTSAIIYIDSIHHQPLKFQEPVSSHSTSYHGELAAIRLALKQASVLVDVHNFTEIVMLSVAVFPDFAGMPVFWVFLRNVDHVVTRN